VSQKVTEEAQRTAAEAAGTPEEKQTPEAAGTQEVSRRVSLQASSEVSRNVSLGVQGPEETSSKVSRKMSLEVRRFPTQQLPQVSTYRWSQEDLTHYLPEDRYLPEDPTY
jgi:hypothetical protein